MGNHNKIESSVDSTVPILSEQENLPSILVASTEALESTVKTVEEEMLSYFTEGKTYSSLCIESKSFRSLFRSLNTLNECIKSGDRKRKEAIKNSPRPVSKVRNDAFLKRIRGLSQAEFDELRKLP